MVDSNLYARLVESEWEHTDRLNAAVSFQSGLALATGGGIAYLAKGLRGFEWSVPSGICLVFGVAALLGWACQVWLVFRAWYGHRYAYIPRPSVLRATFDSLVEHYVSTCPTNDDSERLASEEFSASYLPELECKIAEHNQEVNRKRSSHLHNARGALGLSICTLLPALFGLMMIASGPQTVRIDGPVDVNTVAEKNDKKKDEPAKKKEPVPKPPPVEPEFRSQGDAGGVAPPKKD